MDEKGRKKHIREPPSVPFLWEVKPGIPKKDWKPEVPSVGQFPKTPLKLIASVPFVWEEKPGKPIPNFSNSSVDSVQPKPEAILIHVASSSSGHTVATSNYGHGDKDKESSSDNVYQDSSYSEDSESINGIGLETFSFDTDESFSSVPSLLANCLVTPEKVSSAIPVEENSLSQQNCNHHQLETPLSPTSSESEMDSCTRRSSPTGATFLEYLFPLYPPRSGFLEREGHSEDVSSNPLEQPKAKEFDHEEYTSDMIRRPPTLGELIMMSRRRSNRRKAIQMKKWDPPKEITRKQGLGCFTFVASGNMIEGLLKRNYFPRLKLI